MNSDRTLFVSNKIRIGLGSFVVISDGIFATPDCFFCYFGRCVLVLDRT